MMVSLHRFISAVCPTDELLESLRGFRSVCFFSHLFLQVKMFSWWLEQRFLCRATDSSEESLKCFLLFFQWNWTKHPETWSPDLTDFMLSLILWQINWFWSGKTKPGRKPWITADRHIMTWFQSATLISSDGSRKEPKTPRLLSCGWDCSTAVLHVCGFGSLIM